MKLFTDTADLEEIEELFEYYPVDGVTTNPTILSRVLRSPYETLSKIRDIIGPEKELFAQVISKTAEDMAVEAEHIVDKVGGKTIVKIPAVPEGIKAMKLLSGKGIPLCATAVFSPAQAFLAAKCGAAYVAPYVNSIDNTGGNGIEVAETIQDIFDSNGYKTIVLAASFKNVRQFTELAAYGIGAATLPPDVFRKLADCPSAMSCVDTFTANFEALTAPGKTMKD